ncbi:hypothetical protein APHAL10511_003230 [Amanita phalloides]|nr:hypothetical protein APHAL10511_003230 [Amanita phalloides]
MPVHIRHLLIALFTAVSFLCALVQTAPIPGTKEYYIYNLLITDLDSRIFHARLSVDPSTICDKFRHDTQKLYQCTMEHDPVDYHTHRRDIERLTGYRFMLPGQIDLIVPDKMILDLLVHDKNLNNDKSLAHNFLHCRDRCYKPDKHLRAEDDVKWAIEWKLCQFYNAMKN